MIIRNVDICGYQNIEKYLSQYVFSEIRQHDLIKVEQDESNLNKLTLYFDEEENGLAKNFVKQMSHRKYGEDINGENLFIIKTLPQNFQTHMAKVKTKKYTLFFFSEKSRVRKIYPD